MTDLVPLADGRRVRHAGEQYPDAYSRGTGTVVEHKIMSGGHVEYRVRRDRPILPDMPRESWWAASATITTTGGPE